MQFPPYFIQRMKKQLGPDWENFAQAHRKEAPVSLRVHPLKWRDELADELPRMEPIPWCEQGYYLTERPHFARQVLWHAGAYYVQEASSMLLAHLLAQIKLPQNAFVLDLGASPGGKSTLLLDYLPKGSILLANEPLRNRLPALRENLQRWGYPNVLISQHQASEITASGCQFDLILIDAPCSGEGLFRKRPEAVKEWNEQQADFCALRQTKIIQDILPALKSGGHLIYSTCTYNPNENEKQVKGLVKEGFREIHPEFPSAWQIERRSLGYQCYPHQVKGEGFYFALLQKEIKTERHAVSSQPKPTSSNWKSSNKKTKEQLSTWLPNIQERVVLENPRHGFFALLPEHAEKALHLLSRLRRCRPIAEAARLKGKLLRPAPASALQIDWHAKTNRYELSAEEAQAWLRGSPPANPLEKRGYLLLTYRQLPLAWAKGVPGRMNLLK